MSDDRFDGICPDCGGDEFCCDLDDGSCSEAVRQARLRDFPSEAMIERSQRRLAAILGEPDVQ